MGIRVHARCQSNTTTCDLWSIRDAHRSTLNTPVFHEERTRTSIARRQFLSHRKSDVVNALHNILYQELSLIRFLQELELAKAAGKLQTDDKKLSKDTAEQVSDLKKDI